MTQLETTPAQYLIFSKLGKYSRGVRPVIGLALIGALIIPNAALAGRAIGKSYEFDAETSEQAAIDAAAELTSTDKQTILNQINTARSKPRLCGTRSFAAAPAVTWNLLLEQAAQRHSNDMATKNFFSHTGSDGSTPASRITDTGYRWSFIGENIAAGFSTPQSVISAWLKSAGHCANIMNRKVKHIGMAKAVNSSSRYGVYWTLDLAAPL